MWPFQWTPETKGLSTPAGSLLWWGGKCFWAGILRFVNQSLSILNILSITTHNFLQAIVDIIWLLPSPFQILWSCGYEWISEFFFITFPNPFLKWKILWICMSLKFTVAKTLVNVTCLISYLWFTLSEDWKYEQFKALCFHPPCCYMLMLLLTLSMNAFSKKRLVLFLNRHNDMLLRVF